MFFPAPQAEWVVLLVLYFQSSQLLLYVCENRLGQFTERLKKCDIIFFIVPSIHIGGGGDGIVICSFEILVLLV